MKEALCALEDEQEKVAYVKNTPLQSSTITIKTWCQVQKRKTDLSWQEVSTFKSVLNISVDYEYARTSKTGEKRVISYPSILAN